MKYSIIISKPNGNIVVASDKDPLVIQEYCIEQLRRKVDLNTILKCQTILNRVGKIRLHIVRN